MFSICRESRSLPAEGADFLVETATGEASVKELEGIVVAMRPARIFFAKPYGSRGGKRPPSCTSINGMEGIGDPDVKCRDCPYSKFGSAQNPDGSQKTAQAC